MATINRLDCRGSHLLVECEGRFAVVESRAGKVYGLRPDRRDGYPDTPEGMAQAIRADWKTETAAVRLFDRLTRDGDNFARRMR